MFRKSIVSLLVATALMLSLMSGCVVHTRAAVVDPAPTAVVVTQRTAPWRVHHQGRYLYYRSNGYYHWRSGRWVRANSVPSHVVHFHVAS